MLQEEKEIFYLPASFPPPGVHPGSFILIWNRQYCLSVVTSTTKNIGKINNENQSNLSL